MRGAWTAALAWGSGAAPMTGRDGVSVTSRTSPGAKASERSRGRNKPSRRRVRSSSGMDDARSSSVFTRINEAPARAKAATRAPAGEIMAGRPAVTRSCALPTASLTAATSRDRSNSGASANAAKSAGAPRIGIYTIADRSLRLLRGNGYANPSWSPDGTRIAAERTSGRGRDVVILDAQRGGEVARLTDDGRSFAPAFAPDGT